YLLLPNGFFHAGLMDVESQNKRLESLRTALGGMLKDDGASAFFIRGYGSSYRYDSDLPASKYGYGGQFDYNAVDAGVLLWAIESMCGTAFMGITGTYGRLFLQPLDVKQSQKSAFDKWSVSAYGSMRHDTEFYVGGLVSYGTFKGDVSTLARGKAATLDGRLLNASLTAGKVFEMGYGGFVFDPQVQVIYQYLTFKGVRDIDNVDVKMGNLDQWVARVGGRLVKVLPAVATGHAISFYGKLNFAHAFGEKQFVHLGDAFQLGAFGSSLEAGLGFNAQLVPKLVLHGDLSYQHKLTKAGFFGVTFSGGVRY
ncbi:autotransporter outer membrane beta-barrel domain-containing protein, partial [Bartonella sp. CB178]|uniref:autotransporter outer membrane beta-barrel domain-containing protein n=1 Tax=Bartonella sp. CB178 TaxID=3112255 RepID=UPI00300E675F